jgi:hypothetical protein
VHHASKEAANGVLLPTRRLHDRGDRCPLGLSKQGEDGPLLCPATGREPAGMFPCLESRFAPRLARANLVFVEVLLCDILGSLSVATASGAVTTEAPQWPTVTLLSPLKSTPFCDEN